MNAPSRAQKPTQKMLIALVPHRPGRSRRMSNRRSAMHKPAKSLLPIPDTLL
jgi:hypothetical protein